MSLITFLKDISGDMTAWYYRAVLLNRFRLLMELRVGELCFANLALLPVLFIVLDSSPKGLIILS